MDRTATRKRLHSLPNTWANIPKPAKTSKPGSKPLSSMIMPALEESRKFLSGGMRQVRKVLCWLNQSSSQSPSKAGRRTLENRDVLARGGCPFGTLCSELHKEGGPLAEKSTLLFGEPLAWIEDQFRADGHGDDSRGFAIHLLSALQGVSVLAHGSREPKLVVMETSRLLDWIRAL